MKSNSPLYRLVLTKAELRNRNEIIRIIKKAEPAIEETEAPFKAAMVLLLLAYYGHGDIEKLVRLSTYEHEFVTTTLQNIARGGLYKNGKVIHSGWFDKDTGGLSFWLDVSVAQGLLERVKVTGHECVKCRHQWPQRGKKPPKVCPKCKSTKWGPK